MKETLKIQTRLIYGRPLSYPMCQRSALLLKLKHLKAPRFTPEDLRTLKALGYTLEEVPIEHKA